MTYASEVLADAPLGYWRLNEASGTTMADSSGNGHAGTYGGTVTLGAAGLLASDTDTALSVAGAGHGDLPYAAWMDAPTSLTVEAWIKTTSTGSRSILDRDSSSSGSARVWQFRVNGGALEFVKISGGVVTASKPGSLNDGVAHHVAATYDGTSIRLYIDGALALTTSAAGSLTGTGAFTIGANRSLSSTGNYGQFFTGTIDEAAIYGTVLSDSRIAAHYAAATAVAIKIGGAPWVAPAVMLDGTAKVGLRVAGDPWAAPATWIDGGIPVTTPVLISGSPWAVPATLLDGLGAQRLDGEPWTVGTTFADGSIPGQPLVLLGEPWAVSVTEANDTPPVITVSVGTNRANRGNGIRLSGSAVTEVDAPLADDPPNLTTVPIRIITPTVPAPTLVNGRPQ